MEQYGNRVDQHRNGVDQHGNRIYQHGNRMYQHDGNRADTLLIMNSSKMRGFMMKVVCWMLDVIQISH
jgi:hypothetical protein